MICADFKREYGFDFEDIYLMPTLRFLWYLNGLSGESRWAQIVGEKNQRRQQRKGGSGRVARR